MRASATIQLSTAKKALLDIFCRLNFGRVEGLEFRDGEPVLRPLPRMIQTIRFGEDQDAPTATPDALADRPTVRQLMRHMDRVRDGRFARIEVRASSPVFSEIELTPASSGGARD